MGTNYKAPIWRMPENANKNVVSNYSMAFDGSESINCGIPTLFNGSTTATISAWVKFRNVTDPDYTSIVSIGTVTTTADLFLRVVPQGSSRRIECGITNSFARAGTSDFSDIPSDTWTHFMCFIDRDRNDGSDVSIFLNGSEIFTSDINSSMANPITQDLLLGSGSGWGNLNGNLSHVALWNTDQRANASAIWNGGTPFNLMVLNNKPNIYYQLGDNSNPNATAGYPNISVTADSVFQFTGGSTYPNTITFGNENSKELQITDKITASIWIKTTETSSTGHATADAFLSRNMYSEGWFIAKRQFSNKIRIILYNADGTGNTLDFGDWDNQIADGKWHHLAFTYDGTSNTGGLKAYVDGQFQDELTTSSTGIKDTIGSSWETLQLGQRQYLYRTISGEYSNLSIFNTDLPATGTQSIESLYSNGVPPEISNYSNLVAWWKLNQSANWEADSSGNWQIPDNRSAYPQSFDFGQANTGSKYITTTYFPNGKTNFTYSTWLNCNFYQQGTPIAAYGGSTHQNLLVHFWTDAGGAMYVYVGSAYGLFANFPLHGYSINEWTNISIVYDGTFTNADIATQNAGRLKLYINGNYEAFNAFGGTIPSTIPSGNTGFYLGTMTPTTYEYGGKMSNVMLFDSSLPATGANSIETLYNNGVPLTTAIANDNLKAWYKLDNTSNYIDSPQNLTFTPDYWSFDPANITPGATEALNFSGGYQNLPGIYEGIEFNDTPLTNNKFIMSFWYNCTKASNDGSYIYHNYSGGTIAMLYNSDQINIYANPATTGGHMMRYYLPATRTGWHHLVIYMNQGSGSTVDLNNTDNLRVYVDGSELSVGLVLGDVSASPVRTEANRLGWTTGGNFEGFQFSNLSLLVGDNAVLSAIPTLYNGGTPGDISSLNPTWWYKLNSSDTSFPTSTPPTTADNVFTVTDSSGNGNTTTGPFYYAKSLTTPSQVPSIQKTNVVTNQGISSGMTEQNLVNNNVSVLNGESGGLNTTNLVQSNLTRKQSFSNYSINFDGTSEYIKLANSSTAIVDWTRPYSISLWVRYSTALSWDLMATFGVETGSTSTTRYIMIGGNSGYLFTGVGDTDGGETTIHFNIGSALDQGDWHHLVYVGDGSSGDFPSVYIDGVLTPYSGGTTALINDSTYLNVIGTGSTATGRYFPGKISNVSIFNTALSQDDVLNLYNNGITQDLNNFRIKPKGWWPMDQSYTYFNGSVLVARDVINSSDGTAVNIIQENLKGDAPGSEVNGTGTNLTIADLEGNMKNSVNNSNSINMGDYASGTNPANSGRSTEIPQV